MINDFLDNLAAHQYQKMHKKKKKEFEVDLKSDRIGDIDYMSDIDDQYSHHFNHYEENLKDDCEE